MPPPSNCRHRVCGEKLHCRDTLIGNDDDDAGSDDDVEEEVAISVASEDDKRPGTLRRDQWTKGNGDVNLLRRENNKACAHGPVWPRCGVISGRFLARLLLKMAVASFTSKRSR